MKKYALGIDIGGTYTKMGLVNKKGQIKFFLKINTFSNRNKEKTKNWLLKNIHAFLIKNRIEINSLFGIGIALCRPFSKKSDSFVDPNYFSCTKVNFLELKKEFKIPIFLENDANAAILGEKWKGKAKGKKNALLLTLGTGIGGAIIINGKIYKGADGLAGEIGHIKIGEKYQCSCGNIGCFETYCGGKNFFKRIQKKYKNPAEFFESKVKYDKKTKQVINEAEKALSETIANLNEIFDPEIIILTGSMAKILKINKQVFKKFAHNKFHSTKITRSSLNDKSAILGISKIVFNAIK